MNEFASLWTDLQPVFDSHHGEAFLYQPMMQAPAGGRDVIDATRPAAIITGIFTDDPNFVYPETRGTRANRVAQEANEDLTIDIAYGALPYEAKSNDLITRVGTAEVFKVNGPQPDGLARLDLRVVKLR